jgi:hypothetical protein
VARVLVAAQTTPGAYPTLPIGANTRDLQMQAGDASLGNYTPLVAGKTLVIFHNTGVGARTVTFTSQADTPYNRTGDISAYSIGAGEHALFGPFAVIGWSDAGNLDIDVSHAEVMIAVITLP